MTPTGFRSLRAIATARSTTCFVTFRRIGLNISLIDPFALQALKFETIRRLAAHDAHGPRGPLPDGRHQTQPRAER